MIIFKEPAAVSHLELIDYESLQRWEPPHEHEVVSEQDKGRIISNMRRAFATRHYEMDLMNEPRGVLDHARKVTAEDRPDP